jgi:hypothetical protein
MQKSKRLPAAQAVAKNPGGRPMNLEITIPDHLVATGDKLAKRMGVSRNELFRLALTQLLEELHADQHLVAANASQKDDDEDW